MHRPCLNLACELQLPHPNHDIRVHFTQNLSVEKIRAAKDLEADFGYHTHGMEIYINSLS
jgi:hypothetical protein